MRIGLTSIYVDDVAKAFAFYTTTLGFFERTYVPEAQLAIVASADDPAGPGLLLEPNRNAMTKTYQDGMRSAGMPVASFSVENLDAEYERLKHLGVRFRQAPNGTDGRTPAVFEDTCGNLIQLVQDGAASPVRPSVGAVRADRLSRARMMAGVSRFVGRVRESAASAIDRVRELLGERGTVIGAWAMLVAAGLVVAGSIMFYVVWLTSPGWGDAFLGFDGAWLLPPLVVVVCAALILLGGRVARTLAVDTLVYCAVLLALFIWVSEGAVPDWPAVWLAFLGYVGPLFAVVPAVAGILTARVLLWPLEIRTPRSARRAERR